MSLYKHCFKRLTDLLLCGVTAPVVLPTITALSIVSYVFRQDTIIYCHRRPGRYGKLFTLYKMGTLKEVRESEGHVISDGERQNSWGKFMRDYSLDELPQWLNIVKGDMSWVGPRPLLKEYLTHYTARQSKRHAVRPGLTGLAQVNGRNALPWNKKIALDVGYVQKLSFKLDCYIVWRTIKLLGAKQEVNYGKPELVGPLLQ